jgi:hypothetical protein
VAKNPYMSAWLSAANKVANTARGQVMAAGKAQARRSQKDMVSAWFDALTPPTSKSKGGSAGRRKSRKTTLSSTSRAKRR